MSPSNCSLIFKPENPDLLSKNVLITYAEEININLIFRYFTNKVRFLEKVTKNINYPKIDQDSLNFNQSNFLIKDQEKFRECSDLPDNLVIENRNLKDKLKNLQMSSIKKDYLYETPGLKYMKFPMNFSKILLQDELTLLKKWFKNKYYKIDLLYSSEIHGEQVETFHKKCDGVKNTLVLFFSNYERRFGGYSTLPWSSKRGFVKGTGEEFLFSLDDQIIFKQEKNFDKAIYNNPDYFPTFGSGCDLNIYRDCFEINHSYTYSNLQHSYGKTQFLGSDKDSKNFLAGGFDFRVIRMEVFKIYFN